MKVVVSGEVWGRYGEEWTVASFKLQDMGYGLRTTDFGNGQVANATNAEFTICSGRKPIAS